MRTHLRSLTRALAAPAAALGLLVSAAPSAPAQSQRPAEHVVLISIDGLRPEVYLDPAWPTPMLQRMAREGAHAVAVRSVFPAVTLAAHTTTLTGALPARHGIVENRPFEPGGSTGRWYMDADSIRVPTLWDALRDAGLETANVAWPLSFGAPITRNVPAAWPQDERAVDFQREHTRPRGLFEELEAEATGRLHPENFTYHHLVRDDLASEMAAHLLRRYRPALLTVHLLDLDQFQHAEGLGGPTVQRAAVAIDRAVSRIAEAAEAAGILDRTAFVVVGDHGFSEMHTRIAPNRWLVEAGLLGAAPDRGDWRAAFHSAGGTALLHLRRPGDTAAVEEVRRIVAALPPGLKGLVRILEREEIAALGGYPEAALALATVPGIVFNESTTLPEITPVAGGTHGYPPDQPEMDTGLLAWGAGIRPGVVVPRMGLADVAPLVAALLGVRFDAPDGVLLEGMLLRPGSP